MAKKKKQRNLSPLSQRQKEIMEIVWELGEASVFEVRNELLETTDIARNTVRTTMERLEEKGWLEHRVIGRTFFYSAVVLRNQRTKLKIMEFIEDFCGGSAVDLMSTLIEHRGLTRAELTRIEKMLDEAKPGKKKG